MKFLRQLVARFKPRSNEPAHIVPESLEQINDCVYCKQKDHIYVPSGEIFQYKDSPEKSNQTKTLAYEYQGLVWEPGSDVDILVPCRAYYSPDCQSCFKRFTRRNGKVCEGM